MDTQTRIRQFSVAIDKRTPDDPAATLFRLAKIAEQAGEALGDYIRHERRNVIKEDGEVTRDEVADRVLSVAFSALACYEHMTGNSGDALTALSAKAEQMHEVTLTLAF